MLKIRLKRIGRRNNPSYRVIVTDSRVAAKKGKPIELLGVYDTVRNKTELNKERIQYWMSEGAQPSDTMHNILIANGVIQGVKRNALPKKRPQVKQETETPAKPAETKSDSATPTTPETKPDEEKTSPPPETKPDEDTTPPPPETDPDEEKTLPPETDPDEEKTLPPDASHTPETKPNNNPSDGG